jgi:hypothetical protein
MWLQNIKFGTMEIVQIQQQAEITKKLVRCAILFLIFLIVLIVLPGEW